MILDEIENIDRYQLPQKKFETLKKIISTFSKDTFQKGRFEISGDTVFGIGLEYETKKEDKCLWEAHRKYIDIHIILRGEEKVSITDIEYMKVVKDYDLEGDYALFEGEAKHSVILKEGHFLILYPNEVHKTSIMSTKEAINIKKIVFKIKLADEY